MEKQLLNRIIVGVLPIKVFTLGACLMICSRALSNTANIVVQVDNPGARVSPTLFGIFFEEINFAGEGGLYAELVRNRGFEDPNPTNGWAFIKTGTANGQMTIDTSIPLNTNTPRALRLSKTAGTGIIGVANAGYWGMYFQAGQTYELNFYARRTPSTIPQIIVQLQNATGTTTNAQAGIGVLTTNWQRFSLSLTPTTTETNGRLVIGLLNTSTVCLDVISLFPKNTFKGRTNGLRNDLAELLAALRPSFVRFPGGCYVEGNYLSNAFQWKKTVGDIAQRPGHMNDVWGYFSTDGLGYHEYLQLCEDLGAEPLFVINCGMAHNEVVPLELMSEYVQNALDAIQYANGATNTPWGALRAANGHPKPFNLKYIQIGNENGGSAYNQRYALFYDAIKSNYPNVNIVACNWGGLPTSRPVEISDEHYYSNPDFFVANATRYDSYSRSGPKIYVGEYAVTSGCGNGNLRGALAEAAFMTGLERNSDIVVMASYAPLFANVNGKQWNPDLIYFDNWRVCPTPSYYVQQLFSQNRGDVVLPVTMTVSVAQPSAQAPRGAIGVGSWNTQVEFADIVVRSNDVTLYQSDFVNEGTNGWWFYRGVWLVTNGVFRQTAIMTDCRATRGDTNWSNYTITLRARKVSGQEGFLIIFNWLDDDNWTWWNIGGWNNSQHAIEVCREGSKSILGNAVSGSVETGRWYNIQIELEGDRIKCYLDGVLVHDVRYDLPRSGAIGLGTWNTAASFTNVVVTKNGATLYQSDFVVGASEWRVYRGTWVTGDGIYRQTAIITDCRSTTGDANWSGYTLRLKARKDSGNEGFLIIFNWRDDNNWIWWNIGGWNNTQHAIELCHNGNKSILGTPVSGSIETGRWYDIRVELEGEHIRCYLDDQLIHDVTYPSTRPVHASATYHEATGQVILKIVNVASVPVNATINLLGVQSIAPHAQYILLTSQRPTDENTLDEPNRVVPVSGMITNADTNFVFELPAYSLVILRLQMPPIYPVRVGLGCSTNLNDVTQFTNGVPVRLSSFITNTVTVDYLVHDATGQVIANGTVEFVPGQLEQFIELPNANFFRITLQNPTGAIIDGVNRAYFVVPQAPSDPLRLQWARFPDETVLYWTDSTADLLTSTNLPDSWIALEGVTPPWRLDFADTTRFYRLRR